MRLQSMSRIWKWLVEQDDRITTRSVIQVAVRVAALLIMFDMAYVVFQPTTSGYPTLYNWVYPGRLRFALVIAGASATAPVVTEFKLPRLMADHVIARPRQPGEFRVVALGSSETFSPYIRPDESFPVVIDRLGLTTPDNRPVRVYNLSYPAPSAPKDLLIADYVMSDLRYRPDAIFWMVNRTTFLRAGDNHPLLAYNPDLVRALAARHPGLKSHLPLPAEAGQPVWAAHNLWSDRQDIAAWLTNQLLGVAWALTGLDEGPAHIDTSLVAPIEVTGWSNGEKSVVRAMLDDTASYQVPLLIVSTPTNYTDRAYEQWLAKQSKKWGIPVLLCDHLLPPQQFIDTAWHMTAAGQRALADQIAAWLTQLWRRRPGDQPATYCPAA
jgi:hypothetical protein